MTEEFKKIIYNLVRKRELSNEEIQTIDKIVEEKDYQNDIGTSSI